MTYKIRETPPGRFNLTVPRAILNAFHPSARFEARLTPEGILFATQPYRNPGYELAQALGRMFDVETSESEITEALEAAGLVLFPSDTKAKAE